MGEGALGVRRVYSWLALHVARNHRVQMNTLFVSLHLCMTRSEALSVSKDVADIAYACLIHAGLSSQTSTGVRDTPKHDAFLTKQYSSHVAFLNGLFFSFNWSLINTNKKSNYAQRAHLSTIVSIPVDLLYN